MVKSYQYDSKILETLENESLNLKNLYKSVMNKTGQTKGKSIDKNFLEALINLYTDNKIDVVGYDIDVHKNKDKKRPKRIQAFIRDGVIFELVKTEQTDVFLLLNQLEGSNPKKSKEAKNKLRKLFKRKLNQFEKQEINFWEMMKSNTSSIPIEDAIKELNKELEELKTEIDEDILENSQITKLTNRLNFLQKKYSEHKNAKLWYFTDISVEDIKKAPNIDLYSNNLLKDYERIRGMNNTILIDEKGDWTKEVFLNKAQIHKPEYFSPEEIRTHLNRIIFYVNTHENYNFMKYSFSFSLSDEKESMDWFELLIKEIANIEPLREKLIRELRLTK